jgi:hypothetical protein
MNDTKVLRIIKVAKQTEDKKLARELRVSALESILEDSIVKHSQDYGILQTPFGKPMTYETRDHFLSERGGQRTKKLYDIGPVHEKSIIDVEYVSRSLSTRYSPDRIGVQARRISDGVYQDPITNKTYDWNEGFTTEDGKKFPGGSVELQTDIMYL